MSENQGLGQRGQPRLISRITGSPLVLRDFVAQAGPPRGAIHGPNTGSCGETQPLGCSDVSRDLELADRFAVRTGQQRYPHAEAQVFADKADRAITHQEVSSSRVE